MGQVGGAEEVDEGDVQLSSALRAYGPAQPACPESFFGAVSRSCPGKTKTVSMALALEAPAVFRDVVEGVWRSVASSAESLCAARIASVEENPSAEGQKRRRSCEEVRGQVEAA